MSENDRRRDDDAALRRLFTLLREQDSRHTPPFPPLAAPQRVRASWWNVVPLPVAVVALLALGAVLFWPGAEVTLVDDGLTLAEWSAPSDSFLFGGAAGEQLWMAAADEGDDPWIGLPTDDLLDPVTMFESPLEEEQP